MTDIIQDGLIYSWKCDICGKILEYENINLIDGFIKSHKHQCNRD